MIRLLSQIDDDSDAAVEMARNGAQFAAAVDFALRLRVMGQEIEAVVPRANGRMRPPGLVLMPFIVPMLQQRESQSRQRGLSEQALSQLAEITCNETTMEQLSLSDSDPACAICCEDYTLGKRLLQLPCKHLFCFECGQEWLRRSCTCPVCRSEVPDEEEESESEDENEWHSEDFPLRLLAQGSPMAAVRRAREAHESGMLELWHPVEEASQVAEWEARPHRARQDRRPDPGGVQTRRVVSSVVSSGSGTGQRGVSLGSAASSQQDEERFNRRREASRLATLYAFPAAQDEAPVARPHASSRRNQSSWLVGSTRSNPLPAVASASSRSQSSVARAIRGGSRAMLRMLGAGTNT